MGFIDSYKCLEKLCGEIFDNDRRISQEYDYAIEEMYRLAGDITER